MSMAIPKVTKQTDLRENLYKTLEEVATEGTSYLVPTKNGDVVIISRQEYDEILLEKELFQEFQESIQLDELTEATAVLNRLDKQFGFKK